MIHIYVVEEEIKRKRTKMVYYYADMKLVLVLYVSWVVSLCHAQPYKAVNLGNWLVTEGWIKPDRFDGIPNKDLLVTLIIIILYYLRLPIANSIFYCSYSIYIYIYTPC